MSMTSFRQGDVPRAEDANAQEKVPSFLCWKNMSFKKEKTKDIFRVCLEGEKYEISIWHVLVKQAVAVVLLFLMIWYLIVEAEFGGRYETLSRLFVCDPGNERSVLFTEADAIKLIGYKDGGYQYCYFKSVMIVISWIMLLPFFLESISILNIILISTINPDVLIPISGGEYAGYNNDFVDGVLLANPFMRFVNSFKHVFIVPRELYRIQRDNPAVKKNQRSNKAGIICELIGKLMLFMAPDLFFTISLFIISYLVMESSRTPDELFVNLVAVQVFATLDEVFVKMLLRPRVSVGESLGNYIVPHSSQERPKYDPFEEFTLELDRHEMGHKGAEGKGIEKLRGLHEYDGFHFTHQEV